MIQAPLSRQYSQKIEKLIPGGVNSPFRSFREVGGHTLFFCRGTGSKILDVDGNTYIDYVGAWGPSILGHAASECVQAVYETMKKGFLFGAPHELEIELAELVQQCLPSIQKVRFVNSGTEAVMSSIRLARGVTKRDLVLMFEGCYHGHNDATLANHSDGIPEEVRNKTIHATFNNLDTVEKAFLENPGKIACVILEPVTGSMGVVIPKEGFLQGLKELCRKYGALLIFDEVLTGFRISLGGAQEYYGVRPDITCLGKALGGGMPIGAYGGSAEIMDHLMPIGKVYQAGTFSGNPMSMAGGVATLKKLMLTGVYGSIEEKANWLFGGLKNALQDIHAKTGTTAGVQIQNVGSMFSLSFCEHPITKFGDARSIDAEAYAKFFHALLSRGIYFPPSSTDAACISLAHSAGDIDDTIKACTGAFLEVLVT